MKKQLTAFMYCFLLLLISGGAVFAQSESGDVATGFLNAWNAQDYAAMYALIHPQSKTQYALDEFTYQYSTIAEKMSLASVTHTIQKVRLQGDSAAIIYDVTLVSSSFGEIVDEGRTMRLMNTSDGWKIAWSTMDIFDTLTDANRLRVQSLSRRRATIYDRNGYPLVNDSGTTVSMYSQRQRMGDEEDCIWLLGHITRETTSYIQQRFNENNFDTVFFLGEVPTEVYQDNQTALYDDCGVGQTSIDVFTSLPHRTYLSGTGVVHTVGYVGQVTAEEEAQYGAGAMIGRSGVETAYQDILGGEPESVLRITDASGITLRELGGTSGSEPVPIMLTLDKDIQLITVNALTDAFNYAAPNWGAPGISPGGAAVVLDVNSGAILGMASFPLYNPSLFSSETMTPNRGDVLVDRVINNYRTPLSNRAVQEQFSPGSVFKIITLAAALNEGLVGLDDIFYCDLTWEGQEYGDTKEIRYDWRHTDKMEPSGDVTPAMALMSSCNPFFWQHGALLFSQVGATAVNDYARRMGLGQKYGFNNAWPEAEGQLPIPLGPDAAINEAVGQGDVTLPPIQMVAATVGIANGGTVYKPYLVQQIGGMDGTEVVEIFAPTVLNELDFNPGVIDALQEGMCGVITNEKLGTAWGRFHNWGPEGWAETNANYTLCGKTGTAETGGNPNAWFIAYAPAENPEIAVVVMVEQSKEGSQIATPIVRRILDDYFGQPREVFPFWWGNEAFLPLEVPEGGGMG